MIKKILLLFAFLVYTSAFTVRPVATQTRIIAPVVAKDSLKPRPMFVDWGVPEIASQPIGSIIMLVLGVSFWEIAGRFEK